MVEEESREKFLREMRNGSLHVDQVRIVDEMAAMPGYMEEWVARCREGDIPAWVLYGQINFEFWEMLGKLESMFGPASGPGAALLDG